MRVGFSSLFVGLFAVAFSTSSVSAEEVVERVSSTEEVTEHTSPTVTLSTNASVEAPHDVMVVIFGVAHSGASIGELNKKVLSQLNEAITLAKAHPAISVKTRGVHTSQTWGPNGKPSGWNVSGQMELSSSDMETLGGLAGRLSQSLQIHGVHFKLSDQEEERIRNSLLNEAAAKFRSKANTMASAFGYDSFEISALTADMPHFEAGQPLPRMRATLSAVAPMAAEVMPTEGGSARISVTLNGTVRLKNAK